MPRKNLRRAASKEALKQMQLLSAVAYDDTETFEITSDEDVVTIDMPPKKKYRLSHRKSSDGNDRDVIVLKTIGYGEDTLKLEAWPEELTPVQLALHSKAQKETSEMNNRIEQLAKQVGAEILYQGDTCSAMQIGSNPPALAFPGGQQQSQQNVVLTPSKTNNNQNSYQLVMDPRLGLIVGTMTPAASAAAAAQTSTTQPVASPTTSKQLPRRRGRPSLQTPVQISSPQPPIKAKVKPTSSGGASVVQLRPTESTAVGGLNTGSSVPSTVTSTVVDLTADDGRPLADSREISFNKLQGKTFPSLVVVARPHLRVKDATGGDRSKLDNKVKNVLMHVPTKFTEWLIQQGLVRSDQSCSVHPASKLKLGMYSDVTKFPYSGGYVWISECCPQRFVSVFSGSLFEGSPHPPSVILKLMYHWACQTNVQNVVQWVKVDNVYVKGMYNWLRAICSVALHTHLPALGGPGRRVEVGVISLGTTSQDGQQRQVKVEVLGLLETDDKLIRLRAVEPLADGDRNYKKRFSKILEPLLQWVHPESIIVTDLTVDKSSLHSMGFAHVQQSTTNEHGASNHTIMEYLRRIVPRMFQNTLSLLSRQIIQQFLDELVWREWFGPTASQAFDSMVTHLSEQTRTDTGQSLIMRLNKVGTNPFKNWSIRQQAPSPSIIKLSLDSPSAPTKRTSTRQRKVLTPLKSISPAPVQEPIRPPKIHSPDIPEQMVPLENYYYGTIEGNDPHGNIKIGWNIKCTMCKSHFSNNIKLMTHLFSHAHNVSGNAQQCRYCLSSVATQEGLAKHITTSHPFETRFAEGFVCVICETRFNNAYTLGKHLSKEHVPSELPYQCGTCSFRCSSHRQAIDHFYQTHDNGASIQCPFCLKSTSLWSAGRVMPQNLNFFMQHLQKHQKKAMAKKCSKCALWFIHKDTLKEHQIKMHMSQRRKTGLIAWSAPRNGVMVPKSKQDKQMWEGEEEINFSNLTFNVPNALVCKECKTHVTSPGHYQAPEGCSNDNCQYITCCKNAMETHSKICKDLNSSLPIFTLPSEMHCVCGYSDTDGNILAKHLAECERKSAYPTAQAAKAAITTHSMLDVLGLVRRPEEPVISAIEIDADKKEDTALAASSSIIDLDADDTNIEKMDVDSEEKTEDIDDKESSSGAETNKEDGVEITTETVKDDKDKVENELEKEAASEEEEEEVKEKSKEEIEESENKTEETDNTEEKIENTAEEFENTAEESEKIGEEKSTDDEVSSNKINLEPVLSSDEQKENIVEDIVMQEPATVNSDDVEKKITMEVDDTENGDALLTEDNEVRQPIEKELEQLFD